MAKRGVCRLDLHEVRLRTIRRLDGHPSECGCHASTISSRDYRRERRHEAFSSFVPFRIWFVKLNGLLENTHHHVVELLHRGRSIDI